MDPIGLGFENFDAVGAFRTEEAGKPIDASGSFDGVAFKDARELVQLLKERPESSDCLVRSLYRYASGRVEGAGEEVALSSIKASFLQGNYRFLGLVKALTEDASFSTLAKAP